MFANRFSAFVDACSLVGTLKRNTLLSLAEAEFFRIRWSAKVMEETETALVKLMTRKGIDNSTGKAAEQCSRMMASFPEAMTTDHAALLPAFQALALPDPGDAHVMAAALAAQANTIVTENVRHFPASILTPFNMDARTADNFLADIIDLDPARAVVALRRMRERFNRPALSAEALLLKMEADGLTATVDVLKAHVGSL